jgi:hypothetical protein
VPVLSGVQGRRAFLLLGLTFLAGCSSTRKTGSELPGPAWKDLPDPQYSPPPATTHAPPPARAPAIATPSPGAVIPRTHWSRGGPVPGLMHPMTRIRYVTVHHDGMRPFLENDSDASARRIEAIRRGHRGRGWGDIGYHYVVDRGGRVWEARPVAWQGAHVKVHNPGNIGIVALGNFDEQEPTPAQVSALNRQVSWLMQTHGIPVQRVRTHQEWMPTRCPGRAMQGHMTAVRSNGGLA